MPSPDNLEDLNDEQLEIRAAGYFREAGGPIAARRFLASAPNRDRCIRVIRTWEAQPEE
jgi:hypothetical protein